MAAFAAAMSRSALGVAGVGAFAGLIVGFDEAAEVGDGVDLVGGPQSLHGLTYGGAGDADVMSPSSAAYRWVRGTRVTVIPTSMKEVICPGGRGIVRACA